jgi:hypothetical protein
VCRAELPTAGCASSARAGATALRAATAYSSPVDRAPAAASAETGDATADPKIANTFVRATASTCPATTDGNARRWRGLDRKFDDKRSAAR